MCKLFIIFILSLLCVAQSVTATSQFIVADCNLTDRARAVSICDSYGGLAMPKTPALLTEADSVFSLTCQPSPYCAFWVGATCTSSATAQWTDGSAFTVYSPGTPCSYGGQYISYLRTNAVSSYDFTIDASHTGVICEGIPCAPNYCRSETTATEYDYQQASSCCLCNAALNATGPKCQCAIGSGGTDCDASGTSTVTYNASSEVCSCGCLSTHTGGRCDQRYCTNSADCTSRANSVRGFTPDCNCSCKAQYNGTSCQTRICHVSVDCQGRGTSIAGLYPDCVCQCEKGYGGRHCRALTQTPTLISSESRSITASPITSSTATVSGSETFNLSNSLSPNHSASRGSSSVSRSSIATLSMTVNSSASLDTSSSISQSTTLIRTPSGSAIGTNSLSRSSSRSSSNTTTLTFSTSASGTNSPSRSSSRSPSTSASSSDSLSRSSSRSPSASASGSSSRSPTFIRSLSSTNASSRSGTIPLEFDEITIPMPVPAATTAALSTIGSAIGGVSAAVDSQVVAAVGLVACARRDADSSGDLRALSVVALDGTCEGVLLGNAAAVGSGALLTLIAISVSLRLKKHTSSIQPQPPTIISALATVRAPQLLFSLCAYLMNSFLLCGLQLARDGRSSSSSKAGAWVAVCFPLAVALSFPLLTLLFGARRLLRVTYSWRPKLLAVVGAFVLQSWTLDPSIESHKLFGCVFGSYRRLGCGWPLVAHISFLAGLPMMFATQSSGTCGPLFAFSAALYFLGAVIVIAFRPRRATFADLLHSVTLLVNGLVVVSATTLLYDPEGTSNRSSMLAQFGTAITVLTVLRLTHSACSIVLALMLRLGMVSGVEVEAYKHSSDLCDSEPNLEYSALLWPLRSGFSEADNSANLSEGIELLARLVASPLLEDIVDEDVEVASPTESSSSPPASQTHGFAEGNTIRFTSQQPNTFFEQFLTEDEQFRKEIAHEYCRRHLEELFSMNL